MKRLIFAAIIIFFHYACHQATTKKEEVKIPVDLAPFHGSVFYTYNRFVGNKGDAGARVRLIKMIDSSIYFDQKVDMSGNFSFDSSPCDTYIMVVTSKNVKDDPFHMMRNYDEESQLIKMSTGFVITPHLDSLYRKAQVYDSLSRAVLQHYSDPSKALRLNSIYKDSIFKIALRYEEALPAYLREKLNSTVLSKIDWSIVTVKKIGTESPVIDFGVTFI